MRAINEQVTAPGSEPICNGRQRLVGIAVKTVRPVDGQLSIIATDEAHPRRYAAIPRRPLGQSAQFRIDFNTQRPREEPRNADHHPVPTAEIKEAAITVEPELPEEEEDMGGSRRSPGSLRGKPI